MRFYAGLGAVVGWFALGLQLVLLLTADSELSVGLRLNNFFSYFTVLSNLLTAIALTVAAADGRGWLSRFFARPGVLTGIAIYMTVTFAIYWTILDGIWDPVGWDYVANLLLHGIMPVVIVGFWFLFVPKGTLSAASVAWFMAFPIAYTAYTLVRGPIVDWYPYPFIDASAHTTDELVLNIIVISAGFVILGFIYLLIDNRLAGRRAAAGT